MNNTSADETAAHSQVKEPKAPGRNGHLSCPVSATPPSKRLPREGSESNAHKRAHFSVWFIIKSLPTASESWPHQGRLSRRKACTVKSSPTVSTLNVQSPSPPPPFSLSLSLSLWTDTVIAFSGRKRFQQKGFPCRILLELDASRIYLASNLRSRATLPHAHALQKRVNLRLFCLFRGAKRTILRRWFFGYIYFCETLTRRFVIRIGG